MANAGAMATFRSQWMVQVAIILASLACGTAFWLVVQLSSFEETTLLVPIVPKGIPEEVLLDPAWEPKQTLVKFTVPRSIRDEIKPEKFEIHVDFSNIRAGFGSQLQIPGSTPLTLNDVRATIDGVTPVEILSRQISWTAHLRHARARIVPDFVGEPAPGFERRGFSIVQTQGGTGVDMTVVMTESAERAFEQSGKELLAVRTEPINLQGRREPFFEKKELIFPFPGMTAFPDRNAAVIVEVDVAERSATNIINDVPVIVGTLRQGLIVVVEPPTVQVSVTGRASQVRNLTPDRFTVNVWNVPESPGESRELPLDARIPDHAIRSNVTSLETIPRTVTVRVMAKPEDDGDDQAPEELEPLPPAPTPSPAPTPTPRPTPRPTAVPAPTPQPTPEPEVAPESVTGTPLAQVVAADADTSPGVSPPSAEPSP